jgi:hypothetical protein
VPRGAYALSDPRTGQPLALERFASATSPGGWSYTSEVFDPTGSVPLGSVDLTCDPAWRQIRVELVSVSWRLRGGVSGRDVVWARLPAGADPGPRDPEVEQARRAVAFDGRSPAFALSIARLLALEAGGRARVATVAVTGPALGTRPVTVGWTLLDVTEHATDGEPLRVERYEVTDLETGGRSAVHVAGDVLLEAPGVELVDLDGPPGRG